MKTRLLTLALALTFVGCSAAAEDPEDPVIVMFDDENNETADPPAEDMGTGDENNDDPVEDMGTGESDEEDLAEMEPDIPDDIEPTGNACQAKDAPVQLINTCHFEWSSCADGNTYGFQCDIQNVAGNVFSLCNCFQNGVKDEADKIVDICGAADWAEVEAIVNEQCGWDLE